MIKVLFVCLGNICRSPVAEAIFKKRVQQAQLHNKFVADSAGTSAYHLGQPPDQRSMTNARENGVILDHRARQFCEQDLLDFQYILAMDHDNLSNIKLLAQIIDVEHPRILLIRSFQGDQRDLEVPDPYYGGSQGFQKVFDILEDSCARLIEYLKHKHREY